MNKNFKRALSLLLALCLTLGLAACGKDKNQIDGDAENLSATVYVPEFLDMDFADSKNTSFYGGCTDGQYAYMLVAHYPDWEAGEEGDTTYQILRMPLDGGEAVPMENFKLDAAPEGYDSAYSGVNGISAGTDGTIWVEEYVSAYAYDLPEDFDPETGNYWEYPVTDSLEAEYRVQLDSTGNEITRINASDLRDKLDGESVYSAGNIIDKDGDLYIQTDTRILVMDSSLNIRFSIDTEGFWGSLTLLGDGTVGAVVTESDTVNNTYTRKLQVIDKSAKDWGEAYELPDNVYETYNGSGDYLFYYMKGQDLYGYKAGAEEGEDPNVRLVNLLDADISADRLEFFSILEDGRVVVMARSYVGDGNGLTLATLTPTPRSEVPEKTILTYATMGLGQEIRNRIVNFNRSNGTYRIQVKDYSEYNTQDDYTAGIQKLNTEILAGEVPDLIDASNLPLRQYGAKGILEDLWPYIESDPDIGGREGLMDRVFTSAEQDGKLYQIFESFYISTVVGAASVVGDRTSWTLDDLQTALASMPEGCALFSVYDTKSSVLQMALNMNLDRFVDWNEGKCNFNSDEFKSILAFADNFPLEYDWAADSSGEWDDDFTRISEGRQMLLQESMGEFRDIQLQKAMFSGPVSYIGYPVEDGSAGSAFNTYDGLSMSSTCSDKEGAWSFMREILLPHYTGGDREDLWRMHGGFPTNKADFEWFAEMSMTPSGYQTDENGEQVLDENGNPIETSNTSYGIGNLNVDIYATKQEEYDQIMDLYNQVDRMSSMDTNVYDIVNEVAGSYFAGDRSLDDAAELIQNKVTTYVNESR